LGKNAIAKALKDLDHSESATFLRGVRHIQMEPVWVGEVDTAGVLRGTCILALVQCTDITREETMFHLIDALAEGDPGVRRDAVLAVEQMAGHEAGWLLRLKARLGDKPEVTGQVFESLLRLEGINSVSFAAGFLDVVNEEVAEEAALALGASRIPRRSKRSKQCGRSPKLQRSAPSFCGPSAPLD
jgi:hypothetical protein